MTYGVLVKQPWVLSALGSSCGFSEHVALEQAYAKNMNRVESSRSA